MEDSNSLYEILKVPRDAKPHAIKAAYRAEAMRLHPDRQKPASTQEEKDAQMEAFQKLQDAYDVLMDRDRREQYDISGLVPRTNAQLANDASAYIVDAYRNVVDGMSSMVGQQPQALLHLHSPVFVITTAINERIVILQDEIRAARNKRKMIKKVLSNLKRKDKTPAENSPVYLTVQTLLEEPVKKIVMGETEIRMLRIALKLNAEWDFTRITSLDDEGQDTFAALALTFTTMGHTPETAHEEATLDEWPGDTPADTGDLKE